MKKIVIIGILSLSLLGGVKQNQENHISYIVKQIQKKEKKEFPKTWQEFITNYLKELCN